VAAAGAALPLGSWDALQASGTTMSLWGWAFDPDLPAIAAPVHVYVDGVGTALTADGSRPDVGGAFPGVGSAHGFSWSTKVTAAVHSVCVYAIDVDTPSRNTSLGCRSIDARPALPVANWEVLQVSGPTLSIRGWAFDPNDPTAAVSVHVYLAGRGTALTANGSRPDVGAAFPGAGSSHGFSWSTPLTRGGYQVCLYAIDADTPSSNTPLGCRYVEGQSVLPVASWDVLQASGTTISGSGWAFDPNLPTWAMQVHVYVDGIGTGVLTGGRRDDVAAVYPGAGTGTGWEFAVQAGTGVHRVCVYAIDLDDTSRNLPLGCRDVRVLMTSPTGHWDELAVVGARLLLTGWAYDPDRPGSWLEAQVQVDGRPMGISGGQLPRADVEAVYPGAGPRSGWSLERSVPPGTHQVCVSVPDPDVAGQRTELGCRQVVTTRPLPIGHIDSITVSDGLVHAYGWALDPADPTTSIEVSVASPFGDPSTVADGDRPDIAVAFPGAGAAHGWSLERTTAGSSGGNICFTARTPWGSADIGCPLVLFDR
jgi:hypothetical protein